MTITQRSRTRNKGTPRKGASLAVFGTLLHKYHAGPPEIPLQAIEIVYILKIARLRRGNRRPLRGVAMLLRERWPRA
jgi:hypothetical protein